MIIIIIIIIKIIIIIIIIIINNNNKSDTHVQKSVVREKYEKSVFCLLVIIFTHGR